MCVFLIAQLVWLVGILGSRKPVLPHQFGSSPTDRPMSVRNRCVIEVLGGVFVLSHCFVCECRGFCHRTESDIFLFLFLKLPSLLKIVWVVFSWFLVGAYIQAYVSFCIIKHYMHTYWHLVSVRANDNDFWKSFLITTSVRPNWRYPEFKIF